MLALILGGLKGTQVYSGSGEALGEGFTDDGYNPC